MRPHGLDILSREDDIGDPCPQEKQDNLGRYVNRSGMDIAVFYVFPEHGFHPQTYWKVVSPGEVHRIAKPHIFIGFEYFSDILENDEKYPRYSSVLYDLHDAPTDAARISDAFIRELDR